MQIDDWKIVLFFLIVFAVHSIFLALVGGLDQLRALHISSLALLVTKLMLLSYLYRIAHIRVIKVFAISLLVIGSVYTFAYWLYYFVGDVDAAGMLWTLTAASFTVLSAFIVKKMYEINNSIMKRLWVAGAILLIGIVLVFWLNGGEINESTIAGSISMVSFALLYLAFSLNNLYMRLFSFSYIVMVLTDIAFFNFYGQSLEAKIVIDTLYFFIYSIWVLLFGGLILELKKIQEKEMNIIERWKNADA